MSTDQLSSLKDALPEYLERNYSECITTRSTGKIQMRCPFHEDKNPSFSANNKTGTWLFHCFSCEACGSILDLHALANGLPASSRENIESVAHAVGIVLPNAPKPSLHERKKREKFQEQHRQAERQATHQKKLTTCIEQNREDILSPYLSDGWKADLWHESPIRIDDPEAAPRDFIRYMFILSL